MNGMDTRRTNRNWGGFGYDIGYDTADGGWWLHSASNWVPIPGVGPFASVDAAKAWIVQREAK